MKTTKHEKFKPEIKTKFEPVNVKMLIIESGKLTEYDLNLDDNEELKITHNGGSLTFKRDEIMQKTFTEMNWHGGVKQLFAFCKLFKNGGQPKPGLIGLEEFNPYYSISAEEADIMLHEGITMRGIKHLVTKMKIGGGIKRIWIFVIILIAIIAIVYLKYKGMI